MKTKQILLLALFAIIFFAFNNTENNIQSSKNIQKKDGIIYDVYPKLDSVKNQEFKALLKKYLN